MVEVNLTYNDSYKRVKIQCADVDFFKQVREYFSAPNESASLLRNVAKKAGRKYKHIPDTLYAITPGGLLHFGLLNRFIDYCNEREFNVKINYDDKLAGILDKLTISDEWYNLLKVKPRDYQEEAIYKALKNGRGIVHIGTGGGKTVIMAHVIANILHKNPHTNKILIVVPQLQLVSQTYNDFKEYGCPFSFCKWTGKHNPDLTCQVVIANQSIICRSKPEQKEWLDHVEYIFVDEVHGLKHDNKILNILSDIPTFHKFGFTGTIPEEIKNEWAVLGCAGPIIIQKASKELRDEGTLTQVEVYGIKLGYNEFFKMKYNEELNFIYNHSKRMKVINSIVKKFNNNSLLLVNHLEHGHALEEYLKRNLPDKQVFFVKGEMDVEDREIIRQKMENEHNIVCVAMSSIFSTGINIKNLPFIVFCAGGKSFIRTVQSIGRGLRKHHLKNKLIIFDIMDDLYHGNNHSCARIEIYKKEKIPYKIVDFIVA